MNTENVTPDGSIDRSSGDAESSPDETQSPEDPALSDYDKTLADSFPASDPPAQP